MPLIKIQAKFFFFFRILFFLWEILECLGLKLQCVFGFEVWWFFFKIYNILKHKHLQKLKIQVFVWTPPKKIKAASKPNTLYNLNFFSFFTSSLLCILDIHKTYYISYSKFHQINIEKFIIRTHNELYIYKTRFKNLCKVS
jgi:hypothetical protein